MFSFNPLYCTGHPCRVYKLHKIGIHYTYCITYIVNNRQMHLFQWVEESYTNFEKGINWRSYVVCDVAYNNVNNWLWTPFIERGIANRIYIEIKFTIRDCSLFPGNALSCKETFSLLYYEFDAATREPPPWEPESYKLIGKINNFLFHHYLFALKSLQKITHTVHTNTIKTTKIYLF